MTGLRNKLRLTRVSNRSRKARVTKHTVVFAGVSCSGKTTLMSKIERSRGCRKLLRIERPIYSTSKFELEKFGYEKLPTFRGTTLLHVEINPAPERQSRKEWLRFLGHSNSVSVVLLCPPRNLLLDFVRERSALEGKAKLFEEKKNLYSGEWLFRQYLTFVEMLSLEFTIEHFFLFSDEVTSAPIHELDELVGMLKAVYLSG